MTCIVISVNNSSQAPLSTTTSEIVEQRQQPPFGVGFFFGFCKTRYTQYLA